MPYHEDNGDRGNARGSSRVYEVRSSYLFKSFQAHQCHPSCAQSTFDLIFIWYLPALVFIQARLSFVEASLQDVLRENTKLSSDLIECQRELVKATEELARSSDSRLAADDQASWKDAEVERLRDRVEALQQVRVTDQRLEKLFIS